MTKATKARGPAAAGKARPRRAGRMAGQDLAAVPTPGTLRAEVAGWVVAARGLLRRILLEAEEMDEDLAAGGSPLLGLIDPAHIHRLTVHLCAADGDFEDLVPRLAPPELPRPMRTVDRMRAADS